MKPFHSATLLLALVLLLIKALSFVSATGCSEPCALEIDIVLVLDESGSINPTEFEQLRAFTINFVNLFHISATEANVGIVLFDDTARVLLPLSGNGPAVINTLQTMVQGKQRTNTQDGIHAARLMLDGSTRFGTAKQFMVVITDGNANLCSICYSTDPENAAIHEASLFKTLASATRTLFGIAVGDQIDQPFIDAISSPGSSLSISGFSELQNIINQLIDAACYQGNDLNHTITMSENSNSMASS